MKSPSSTRLERLLVLLLFLPFVLPLPFTVATYFFGGHEGSAGRLLRAINGDFGNFTLAPPSATPSLATVKSARYQAAVASRFNDTFAGRPWLVRLASEAYLRLFQATWMGIVVGRHDSLYYNSSPYSFETEYCVQRQPPDTLLPIVEQLKQWRDNCRSRGVGFAVVITPSKASIYPEDLPGSWLRRYDPRPRNYDQFVRLLKQAGVGYTDGHLLTLAAKPHAPAPVFPIGGTHWSQYASLATVNALLGDLQSQGQPVRPITGQQAIVSLRPTGEDADMVSIVKPLLPMRYQVADMSFPPSYLVPGLQPNLVIVGGSFVNMLGQQLFRSGQFSEIHWLRYYDEFKELAVPGGWQIAAENIQHLDVEREIFPADCVVLEINEQKLIDPEHLRRFFADTMPRLPLPGTPRPPFSYETYLSCRRGEPLGFVAGTGAIPPAAFSGFSAAGGGCRWTEGPDATLRLALPADGRNALLTVQAGAAIVPGKLPVERVSVFANDQLVAEWVYDRPDGCQHEAVIPGKLLNGGRLVLHFHFSQTISPAQVDGSGDTRQFALLFQQIVFR